MTSSPCRSFSPLPPHSDRGWVKLYCDTVLQADRGVDLDFLVGKSGAPVGKELRDLNLGESARGAVGDA